MNYINSRVVTNAFDREYLELIDYEGINFWQTPQNPLTVNVKPSYLAEDGSVTEATEAVEVNNVLGVLMDEETAGYSVFNEWTQAAPPNARYGFQTTYMHFIDRFWNDYTENAVIFVLE